MIRRPPRATRTDTLFPYTTLFRSIAYLVALARATRESPSLSLGVSPRGPAMLLHAAKAWTWLIGRDFLTPDEIKDMAKPALRHRIAQRPADELEGVSPAALLARPPPTLHQPHLGHPQPYHCNTSRTWLCCTDRPAA